MAWWDALLGAAGSRLPRRTPWTSTPKGAQSQFWQGFGKFLTGRDYMEPHRQTLASRPSDIMGSAQLLQQQEAARQADYNRRFAEAARAQGLPITPAGASNIQQSAGLLGTPGGGRRPPTAPVEAGGIGDLLGGGGGIPDFTPQYAMDPLEYARLLVDLQFDPQEAELRRQLESGTLRSKRALEALESELGQAVGAEELYGQKGDVALQNVYNQLQQELQGRMGESRDIYAQGQQAVQGAYTGAAQQLGEQGQNLQQQLIDAATRLGQGEALTDPLARLQSELQTQVGGIQQAGAGATANLAGLGTQMQGWANQGISTSRGELAQKRGDLITGTQNAIAQMRLAAGKERTQIRTDLNDMVKQIEAELQDIGALRGKTLSKTLADVSDARTEADRRAKMDQLSAQIEQANLVLKQAEISNLPIEQQIKQQELQLRQRELEQQLQGGGEQNAQGYAAMQAYLQSLPNYGPKTQAVIDQALTAGGSPSKAMGIGAIVAREMGVDPQVIQTALALYFGSYMRS